MPHDPSSHPMISDAVKTTRMLQTSQNKLKCQLNAIVKYHKAMILAAKKLEKELKKCT